jgi:hypothetical protein
MSWKRCKDCKLLLEKEVNFYEIDSGRYFSICKKCVKKNNDLKKEKKKEYDKKRYLKKKKEERDICMRCDKYYANVKNNELLWCFHCLEKYEKELDIKLKIEIINKTIKKVKVD